jgi:acyl carrier protein
MAASSDQEILEEIRTEAKALAPHVDTDRLDRDAEIAEVGINSVQTLELVARLEDRFGVTLPDYELAGVESIGDLMRIIIRSQAEMP